MRAMKHLPTIRGWRQLCDVVEDFGFLPFLECGVDGFSVFGLTNPERWEWGGPGNPWWWRLHLPNTGRLVYGKFFKGHLGFISKKWWPRFANIRRNGPPPLEDTNTVLDLFRDGAQLSTLQVRAALGMERMPKPVDDALCELMMHGRLVLSAFRRRRSKRGEAYGWPVAYYRTPAAALGPGDKLPRESPEKSLAAMVARVREAFPDAPVRAIETLLTKV